MVDLDVIQDKSLASWLRCYDGYTVLLLLNTELWGLNNILSMGDKVRALSSGFMIQKTFHSINQKQQQKKEYIKIWNINHI